MDNLDEWIEYRWRMENDPNWIEWQRKLDFKAALQLEYARAHDPERLAKQARRELFWNCLEGHFLLRLFGYALLLPFIVFAATSFWYGGFSAATAWYWHSTSRYWHSLSKADRIRLKLGYRNSENDSSGNSSSSSTSSLL